MNIGREFTVTGAGIRVSSLGVFDYTTSSQTGTGGLANDHDVTLFAVNPLGTPNPTTVTPLATVDVPAGTAAPYESGFPAQFDLPAGRNLRGRCLPFDLVHPYGDTTSNPSAGFPAAGNNITNFTYDPYLVTNPTPASPIFPNGNNGDSGNHAGASFLFTAVPEPASLITLALGAVGLLLAARRRKA